MAAEKNFENKIKRFLECQNAWFVKYFANAFTKSGIPDILVCIKGQFIGIEVKADKGKPSALQIRNLKKIDKAGGYAVLLYPDQYQTFVDMIFYIKDGDPINAEIAYMKMKSRWLYYEEEN